jgi:hypothetical protein
MRSTDCRHTALSPLRPRRDLTPSSRRAFPGLDGLYGYVTVEGHPLEVYGMKQEGNKTIAYVEAFDGKGFSVEFSDQRTRYQVPTSFNMSLAVDGAPYVFFIYSGEPRSLGDGVQRSNLRLRSFSTLFRCPAGRHHALEEVHRKANVAGTSLCLTEPTNSC